MGADAPPEPMKTCGDCMFSKVDPRSQSLACHRYPRPEHVPWKHWCGEHKPNVGRFPYCREGREITVIDRWNPETNEWDREEVQEA